MPKNDSVPSVVRRTVEAPGFADRHPHCILLSGGSERERTSAATYIAQALQCGEKNAPCGACRDCVKIKNGTHPDVTVLTTSGKSNTVHMDDIRAMKELSFKLPNEGRRRILIIPDAARVREEGQNALLKLIEEPPPFVCIIIGAAVRASLLPTVLSRAYDIHLEDAAAPAVSSRAEKKSEEVCRSLVQAMLARDRFALLCAPAPLEKDRAGIRLAAEKLLLVLRDALAGTGDLSGMPEEARRLRAAFPPDTLIAAAETAERTIENADRNANTSLLVTLFSARLAEHVAR